MLPGHVRDLHDRPSYHKPGDLQGKNGFMGWAQGTTAMCSLRTWCPMFQPLQLKLWLKGANLQLTPLLQRVQASNPGNFHVVLGLHMHRNQELRFANFCLDFGKCMETPGCPGRSLLQRQNPHEELLLRQCRREMWDCTPNRVSLQGLCLIEL